MHPSCGEGCVSLLAFSTGQLHQDAHITEAVIIETEHIVPENSRDYCNLAPKGSLIRSDHNSR